ncbi:class I SAM-dependent methyltransferase [bacterium]|nr:class I SAM-dependent methyltransferase [bacterium]
MSKTAFTESFKQACDILSVELSPDQIEKCITHYNLLLKFNQVVNLTALDTPEDIAFKLFSDSLFPLRFINEMENVKILDTGPGGGFPSIPLRILANESISITLVERREKVVFYLEELISTLALPNINVVKARLEDLRDSSDFAFAFQMAVNKATFPDDVFLDKVSPFIQAGGFALHWISFPSPKTKIPDPWQHEMEIYPAINDPRFPGFVAVYKKHSD